MVSLGFAWQRHRVSSKLFRTSDECVIGLDPDEAASKDCLDGLSLEPGDPGEFTG